MLPRRIPIFPLPNVVLFPSVFLPLHIFEPRYREMVEEALSGDRLVGMTLLRPGWQQAYEAQPPVYDVGCAGLITHADRLADGRFNIVLRGLAKFKICGEETGRTFRVATVDAVPELQRDADRGAMREARRRLEALLVTVLDGDLRFPGTMPDEDLVNALAQYLPFEPIERQALLEQPSVKARCESLVELLEMRAIASGRSWSAGGVH